jgi:hypothetical protein
VQVLELVLVLALELVSVLVRELGRVRHILLL